MRSWDQGFTTNQNQCFNKNFILKCFIVFIINALTFLPIYAGPENATVQHGSATIQRQGDLTQITTSHQAIIDYKSFDVKAHETVQFIQPSSSSRVLNRITNMLPTQIDGVIKANGAVYFANPAGIYFGQRAVVDVAKLYAAAGEISNADFLSARDRFTSFKGSVINHGTLRANDVHLMGSRVANYGIIDAGRLVSIQVGKEIYIGNADGRTIIQIEGAPDASSSQNNEPAITNDGTIQVPQGRIFIGAGDLESLAFRHQGEIKADEVDIRAEKGKVEIAGDIDVRSETSGGDVTVVAKEVDVHNSVIDASGEEGGGRVRIGGAYQGDDELPASELTVIQESATIKADAITKGDGGEVIVWSDGETVFAGNISARGGQESGDGGFVETSGLKMLTSTGSVVASALNGQGGMWLLDPSDINILSSATAAGTFTGGAPNTFNPTGSGTATVDVADINASLNSGTSVTITTTSGGSQTGNVTFVAGAGNAISKTSGSDATLRVDAAGDITVNSTIESTTGRLHLDFNNYSDLTISSTGSLSTNGGNITFDSASNGAFSSQGTIDTGAGSLTINHGTGAISVLNTIQSNGGALSFTGGSFNNATTGTIDTNGGAVALVIGGSGAVTLTNTIDLSGGLGAFTIADTAGTISVSTNITAGGGAIQFGDNPFVLISDSTITNTGSGAITFGGTVNGDGGADVLTLSAGSGNISFLGNVGTTNGIGTLSITGTGSSTFSGTLDGNNQATALSVSGGLSALTFSQAIGASAAIGSITASAGDITVANIGGGSAGVTGNTILTATDDLTFTGTTYNANQQAYTAGPTTFELTAGADVTFSSSNDSISFSGGRLNLANGSDLTLSSAGGNITVSSIEGSSDETVTINAGVGAVTSGSIGANVAGGIHDVAITGSAISLSGNIITSGATGGSNPGDITLTGPVTFTADSTLRTQDDTQGDGNITFTSSINGARNIIFDLGDGGNLSVAGVVGGVNAPTAITIQDVNTSTFLSAVTVAGNFSQLDGTGTSTFQGALSSTGAILLNATEINFTGGANSISGSSIVFEPGSSTSIRLGGTADTGASVLDITDTDITALANGYSTITIGKSGANGTVPIIVDSSGARFGDSLVIHAAGSGASVNVTGQLDTLADGDTGSITINGGGGTSISNDIVTSAGVITIDDTVTISNSGVEINSTNGASTGANISVTGDVQGVVALNDLTVDAGTQGNVSLAIDGATVNSIGATQALDSFTVDGSNINLGHVGASGGGSEGVTGATDVDAGNTLTLEGTQYNTAGSQTWEAGSGEIQIVGGSTTTFRTTADNLTFTGADVNLSNGSNLVVTTNASGPTAGAVTFTGNIEGTSDETVSISATDGASGYGNLSLKSVGNSNGILSVNATGATITLDGNILTSSTDSVSNLIQLTGNTGIVLASNHNSTAGRGGVTWVGPVDGSSPSLYGLTLSAAGSATRGNVVATGIFGGNQIVDYLSVTAADVTLGKLNLGDGLSHVGNSGVALLVNSNGGTGLTLQGDVNTTLDTVNTTSDGAVQITGAIVLNPQAGQVANSNVILITTGDSAGTDRGLTFAGNLSVASSRVTSLRLNAGTGAIDLSGATLTGLDSLVVDNASTVTLPVLTVGDGATISGKQAIDVNSSSTITLTGNLDTTGEGSGNNAGSIQFSGSTGIVIDPSSGSSLSLTTDIAGVGTDGNVTIPVSLNADNFESLAIDAGTTGDIDLNASLGATNRVGALTLEGNNIDLDGSIEASSITATGHSSIQVDSGGGNSLVIDTNGGDLTLTSVLFDADSTATFTSTGASSSDEVYLLPSSGSQSIGIGDGAASGSTVDISEDFLQAISSTFNEVVIGLSGGAQTGTITVNDSSGLTGLQTGLHLRAGGAAVSLESGVTITESGKAFKIIGGGSGTTSQSTLTVQTNAGDILIQDDLNVGSSSTLTLDTQSGAGNVSVTGNIRDFGTGNLIVSAGSGAVTFGDSTSDEIGNSSGSNRFGDVQVTTTGNVTVNSSIFGDSFHKAGAGGDVTFLSPLQLNGTSLTASGDSLAVQANNITFQNAASVAVASGGGNVDLDGTGSGLLSIGTGDFNLHTQSGATFSIDGNFSTVTTGSDVETQAGSISILSPLVLSQNVILDTTNGSSSGADLTLSSVDGGVSTHSLSLNAGSNGDVTASGILGNNHALGGLTITDADAVSISSLQTDQGLTSSSTTFTATGAIESSGQAVTVTTDGSTGTVLNLAAIDSNSQSVTLTSSDDIALNGTVESSTQGGTFTIQGTSTSTALAFGTGAGSAQGAGNGVHLSDASVANIGNGFTTGGVVFGQSGQTGAVDFAGTAQSYGEALTLQAGGGANVGINTNLSTTENSGKNITIITGSSSDVTLAGNLSTNGGAISVTGTGELMVSSGQTRTLDTATSQATAGNIQLSTVDITSTSSGSQLVLDASASTQGGQVSIGEVDASGGSALRTLTVDGTGGSTAGSITLHGDILLAGVSSGSEAALSLTGMDIILSDDVSINTSSAGDFNAGAISLGTGAIYGDASGWDLSLNSAYLGSFTRNGGAVTVGSLGQGSGQSFLSSFTINASSTTGDRGTVNLDGDVLVHGSGARAVDIIGNLIVQRDLRIDTNQASGVNAGGIDLAQATISASTSGVDLTLDTSTTDAQNGGAIEIGVVEGSTRIHSLTVDSKSGSTGTDGTITLGQASTTTNLQVEDHVNLTDGGNVQLIGAVNIDTNPDGVGIRDGDVLFNSQGVLNGTFAFSIDTRDATSQGGHDGSIQLPGTVGTTNRLGTVSLSSDTGTISFGNSDPGGADTASFQAGAITVSGEARIQGTTQINSNGNAMDLSGTQFAGSGGLWDLTLSTTPTSTGSGGALSLGSVGAPSGSTRINDLQMDTRANASGSTGVVTLNGDVSVDDNGVGDLGSFTVQGSPHLVISNDVTIDTEFAGNAAAGEIHLGSGAISADAAGYDFSLDARGNGTGGTITLGQLDSTVGGSFLGGFSAMTEGSSAHVNLPSSILLDDSITSPTGATLVGRVQLAGNSTIDTEQGDNSNAGTIDLSQAEIFSSVSDSTLSLNSSTSGSSNAGAVQLGQFNDDSSSASYLRSVSVDATTGSGTSGTVTLHNDIDLDASGSGGASSFTISGDSPVVISNTLEIDTEQGGNVAGGAINLGTGTVSSDSSTPYLLTLNAQGNGTGGNIDFGAFGTTNGGHRVGGLLARTEGSGQIGLSSNLETSDSTGSLSGRGVELIGNVVVDGQVTIDTAGSGVTTGSPINLSQATISANGLNRSLALNSAGTTTGGSVQLSSVGNTTGGNYLQGLSLDTSGSSTDGSVSFSGDVKLSDGGTSTASSLSVTGPSEVNFIGSRTIDLSSSTLGTQAGSIDWGSSTMRANASGSTLTLKTDHTGAGGVGGDIRSLVGIEDGSGSYFDAVTLDASGATDGTISFVGSTPKIEVVGSNGGSASQVGIRVEGEVSIPAGTLTLDTNPSNQVIGSQAIDASQAQFDGPGGLVLDTSGSNASTVAGNIYLNDVGSTTPVSSVTTDSRGTTSSGDLILSGSRIATDGGNIDFQNSEDVQLAAGTSVTLDTETGGNQAAGSVYFADSTDSRGAMITGQASGNEQVVIQTQSSAGDGDVRIGEVGTFSTPLGGLAISAGSGSVSIFDNVYTSSVGSASLNGVQSYNGIVSLLTNPNFTGNLVGFTGSLDGARSVTITGDAHFQARLGGTTPLTSLTVTGSTTFQSAGSSSQPTVTTTGNQIYGDNSTVDGVTFSSETYLSGADLTFDSTLSGAQDLGISSSGAVAFNGKVGDSTSSLTPIGDGTGASIRLDQANSVTFNQAVEVNSGITQSSNAGTLTLRDNVTVRGGDTANTFNGDVTLDGLTFNTQVSSTFGDSTSDQLTVSANSSVRATTLTGDLLFNSMVDGPGGLTVHAEGGTVQFMTAIGQTVPLGYWTLQTASIFELNQSVYTTGDINLIRLGASEPPPVATIYRRVGDVLLSSTNGNVTLGAFHKLTALGNVTILAPNGTVRLEGDITSGGLLTVTANTIQLVARAPGWVRGAIPGIANLDAGLDFVTETGFRFSVAPQQIGSPEVLFASSDGNGDQLNTLTGFTMATFGFAIDESYLIGRDGAFLDLRPQGPQNINVSQALAGAVTAGEPVSIGSILVLPVDGEGFGQGGLTVKKQSTSDTVESLEGRSVYQDHLPTASGGSDILQIGLGRMARDASGTLKAQFENLFAPEGSQPSRMRVAKMRLGFQGAMESYLKASGGQSLDTQKLAIFITKLHPQVAQQARDLHTFMEGMETAAGLTKEERFTLEQRLFSGIKPFGMTLDGFVGLLEAVSGE